MLLSDLLPQGINPQFTATPKSIGNLKGAALSLCIAAIKSHNHNPLLIICNDGSEARTLKEELFFLMPKVKMQIFCDWETLPYDRLSPHQDLISERLKILASVTHLKDGIIITTLPALMSRLAPCDYIKGKSFLLEKGQICDPNQLQGELVEHGYLLVNEVLEHGEFARRGSILDIYPMGESSPYRIDFFDDEVDSIALLDIDTQRSLQKIDKISMLPAHEFPLDKDGISVFRSNYRDAFPNANLQNHVIYQSISKGAIPSGIEYYLPLFFASTSTFFDYLHQDFNIITIDNIEDKAQAYFNEACERAHSRKGNPDNPPLDPLKLFLSAQEFSQRLSEFKRLSLYKENINTDKRASYNSDFELLPAISFNRQDQNSTAKLCDFCDEFIGKEQGRLLITAISAGRRQSLREILPQSLIDKYGIKSASSIADFVAGTDKLMLSIAPFDKGVYSHKQKLALVTESDLLGFKVIRQKQAKKNSHLSDDTIIKNLSELKEGQIVVHIDHGIGRYRGLKTLEIGGIKGEYLTIEYQHSDMLNIPITALNKVARYSGGENPILSRLGSDLWAKKKQKAYDKVKDVAAELLDLYAQRASHAGRSFKVDLKALDEFAAGFGYQETPDQLLAINNTLNDLAQTEPMDRLICGDVGFGKTEVALRAAFVVASSGAQVAVLVPTTVLAEQHYQNFHERFAGTAINVDVISRFKSVKAQNEVLKAVSEGKIDIIIGTHKLLSKSVKFKDLGLIIVDEEHRFGVKQKERLKEIRANVDILTLTATPIPRTLNMAMEGMRELSIIATAPEHRLAVKTFVEESSESIVREAIMRELRRGGQVYYLHNDVATIKQRAEQLHQLVPEARICIGHGQLSEQELQRVMRDFYHQRFNLLVCSTIVENGLDVPTANTIIIDRADNLGLAQLHQIRGRVGRSHHQAYAYLFTPPKALLSKDAKLRLDAIASLEELGAGFVLATHDLEIRGAGELLGEEQSGQIESIGFSLYTEMLNAAVTALKEGHEPSLTELTQNECDINVHLPCLFPDSYIHDVNTRLSLYKRLGTCATPEEFSDFKVELIDRFGFLPPPAENLMELTKLKKLATSLGISKILCDENGGVLELGPKHKISPEYLITLVTKKGYRLSGQNSLRYPIKEDEKRSRMQILELILKALYSHSELYNLEKN